MLERPEVTLLHAVRLLHERGFEGVRASPTFYATGHWRCRVYVPDPLLPVPADPNASGDAPVVLRYTNGTGWEFEAGTGAEPTTVEQLADRLVELVPAEARDAARTPSPAYRFWFSALLDACGDDAVPYLVDDYFSATDAGYVATTRRTEDGAQVRFPLPPAAR